MPYQRIWQSSCINIQRFLFSIIVLLNLIGRFIFLFIQIFNFTEMSCKNWVCEMLVHCLVSHQDICHHMMVSECMRLKHVEYLHIGDGLWVVHVLLSTGSPVVESQLGHHLVIACPFWVGITVTVQHLKHTHIPSNEHYTLMLIEWYWHKVRGGRLKLQY